MKKAIGICGGMGPMAGTELHRRIIERTPTDGTDQDHIEVHHLSYPGIPDRTAFLLGKSSVNPAYEAARAVHALEASAVELGSELAIGIPCNTFHAPEIFDAFMYELQTSGSSSHTVSMIESVIRRLGTLSQSSQPARIGILSTTGTRTAGIYRSALVQGKLVPIEPSDSDQILVHEAIYHPVWGLKATSSATDEARDSLFAQARTLIREHGISTLLLGCTELSLAFADTEFEGIPVVDSLDCLADELIAYVRGTKSTLDRNAG